MKHVKTFEGFLNESASIDIHFGSVSNEEIQDMIQKYIKSGSIGDIRISSYELLSLPDNLTKVGGTLFLFMCKNLTSLPKGLKEIGKDLDLRLTSIDSLPDNLRVGQHLVLSGDQGVLPITSLPKNLFVGGDLSIDKSKITILPDSLRIGGNLDAEYTKIKTFSNNILKPNKGLGSNNILSRSVNLERSRITSLPDNLKIEGDLNLEGCRAISSLPNGLIVGGSLNANGSGITTLPEDLQVGTDKTYNRSLILHRTPISKKYSEEEIMQMVPNVVAGGVRIVV